MAMEKKGRLSEADFRKMSDDDPRKQSWLKAQQKYGEQGKFQDRQQQVAYGRARAQTGDRTVGKTDGGAVGRGTRDQLKRAGRWDDQAERRELIDRGQPRAERAKQLSAEHRGRQQSKSITGQGRQDSWRQSIQSRLTDRGREGRDNRRTRDVRTSDRRKMMRRVERGAAQGVTRGPSSRSQAAPETNQQSINRSNRVDRMPISEERQRAQEEHRARVDEIKAQRSSQTRGTPATYRSDQGKPTLRGDKERRATLIGERRGVEPSQGRGDRRSSFLRDFVSRYER